MSKLVHYDVQSPAPGAVVLPGYILIDGSGGAGNIDEANSYTPGFSITFGASGLYTVTFDEKYPSYISASFQKAKTDGVETTISQWWRRSDYVPSTGVVTFQHIIGGGASTPENAHGFDVVFYMSRTSVLRPSSTVA